MKTVRFLVYFICVFSSLIATSQTVTSVSSTAANGTYKAGDVLPITVTFSANVIVTGTPQLTLETGSADVVVDYTSGSGTSTLTFNYTVDAGHNSSDLDFVETGSGVRIPQRPPSQTQHPVGVSNFNIRRKNLYLKLFSF